MKRRLEIRHDFDLRENFNLIVAYLTLNVVSAATDTLNG